MAYKCYVIGSAVSGNDMGVNFAIVDTSNNTIPVQGGSTLVLGTDITAYTMSEFQTASQAKIIFDFPGYSLTTPDFIWLGQNFLLPSQATSLVTPKSFNYAPGRSIVTGTGATGFQVSSTRDSVVTYSTKITTTATIAGGQEGYVVLEIAPTNSATAGDWKEVGRVTNGQALSLALTLQSIQPVSGILMGIVPAGYYVKIRSVNTTGTPAYSVLSGQEILI